MTDPWWVGPLSASLRRRIRRRRIYRYAVPIISAYSDRLRDRALGGEVCQRFTFTRTPEQMAALQQKALRPWTPLPPPHWCPDCQVERADYEGPGWHLDTCPNCGTATIPVPIPDAVIS